MGGIVAGVNVMGGVVVRVSVAGINLVGLFVGSPNMQKDIKPIFL